ncbi:hypothetical protein C2L66_05925 [Paraburkholderia caribensis]|nr:hypothetical protein C2L66_05925 [Paraburkholderia caribensis]
MAGEMAAGSAGRKSVACAPVRTIHATIAHRTVSCASSRSMAARAPYEESAASRCSGTIGRNSRPIDTAFVRPTGFFDQRAGAAAGKCRTQRNHAEKGLA